MLIKKTAKKHIRLKYILFPVYFIASVMWMEIILKWWSTDIFIDVGLLYTFLFSVPLGIGCAFLCSFFKRRTCRKLTIIILSILSLYYMTQMVYYNIFKSFYMLEAAALAHNAFTQYYREGFLSLANSLPGLFILSMPLILVCFFSRFAAKSPTINTALQNSKGSKAPAGSNEAPQKNSTISFFTASRLGKKMYPNSIKRYTLLLFGLLIATQFAATIAVTNDESGILSPKMLYTEAWTPQLSAETFGLFTTARIEVKGLFSTAQQPTSQPAIQPEVGSNADGLHGDEQDENGENSQSASSVYYSANVLDIDFSSWSLQELDPTLKSMHDYFALREPTYQNEYTGIFEGKNLIFITAEAFWEYAVNEEYTPTLYKLANEGFVFENFYNPLWWKSTIDGEFVVCTGLLPQSTEMSFLESGENSMPFTMGNALRDEGYTTRAYHNHTYNYYDRDISHPNLGYDYYGIGNGLDVQETWPESDLEMMEETIPLTLSGDMPFHNYYMTISGHLNYSFVGNAIAYKNMQAVEDLDMSEEAKAYIACHIELDKALEYILEELEAAGQLENTVICMSSDHYPYGLTSDGLNEFYGGVIDTDFEIYRSPLIIWSADMQNEPVIIEKNCSSLDVLPTLLNLFGVEYDSRLLMGRDILSDSDGLAVFSNGSFITDLGSYNARTDEWTPSTSEQVSSQYVLDTFNDIQDMFTYSTLIIDTDYYAELGLTVTQN